MALSTDTKETRLNNPLTAQILVTVPEVLYDMYMNPTLIKSFVPRIRWVIFDEIHCSSRFLEHCGLDTDAIAGQLSRKRRVDYGRLCS